jgi:hypothetical protein
MSKKLIAVASAAALALTALVGIAPANAVSATVVLTGTGGTSPGTALAPVTQKVPFENTLADTGSALIAFSSIADGDKITITTSGKVKITAAETVGSLDVDVSKLGTQSFSATASAATFNAYAFTTDEVTTEIKWTVTRPSTGGSSSGTLFIKGEDSTEAHIVEVIQAPSTLAKGASSEIRVKILDVFGNPIESTVGAAVVAGAANTVNLVYDQVNKWHDVTITSSTDRAFALTIDANGLSTDDDTNEVAHKGIPANKMSTVLVVNSAGASPAQQSALAAQVATLTAQVAKRVSKKKYNTLARKWNAAFPSQKVALKK